MIEHVWHFDAISYYIGVVIGAIAAVFVQQIARRYHP